MKEIKYYLIDDPVMNKLKYRKNVYWYVGTVFAVNRVNWFELCLIDDENVTKTWIGNPLKCKEVTDVYNKIKRLCKKLKLTKEYEHNFECIRIDNIKKNFETGKYPTKPEFRYMNTVWKTIINA